MSADVVDRILYFCSINNLNQTELSKKLSMEQKTVSNYLNRSRKVSYDFVDKIVRTFDLDANWLLTGEGAMKKSLFSVLKLKRDKLRAQVGGGTIQDRVKYILDTFYNGDIKAMAKSTFVSMDTISRIIGDDLLLPDYDTLRRIADTSSIDISMNWLITGKGEVCNRDYLSAILDISGIPLYRIEAAAGFGNPDFRIEEKDIEARYKIKEFESASFMLHVRGDSMLPTYHNGDVIAVQVVRDLRNIQWGKPHLISSRVEGLLVKRIYEYENEIVAVSDNPTYKPLHLRKDEVDGIAVIKGYVRFENY